ncbi:alkaline phosphatase family protein [Occultella gossypii]|uniref:Alkaline phosphatase family protein n=1 Tax=Occultella gossypii TaxID=2800820 RepID=A0ABS7SBU8_9MICO|nr:ectonucleotide pyrophosphatase/phosphodiesterase [Occultella gossypii]MBZ2197838.1 alkaline phosphatase family protein [Occultella gossypii]
MARNRLLVISVDAMVGEDLEYARTLPTFSRLIERSAIAEIESVFPTVTYPNHTAQTTGCPPATSGIFNNLTFDPYATVPAWFWESRHIRVPTLFAVAKAAGLRTAAVQWPVTAHDPNIDVLVPEVWQIEQWGGIEELYRGTASPGAWETYVAPHVHKVVWSPRRDFNDFASGVAQDILRVERPDVMFLHLVAVDAARHATGPHSPQVDAALRRIDAILGEIVATMEEVGTFESTNIVLVSDHGHLATTQHTNLNALFAERGLLRLDDAGALVDYDVYCHGAGLSAQLFLAEDLDDARRAQVEAVLAEIVEEPAYRIEEIISAAAARECFGLDGPFSYVVISEPGVLVAPHLDRAVIAVPGDADFIGYVGNHGHDPKHGGQPVFIASGPDFTPGVHAGRRSILDEAPTFAAVLGLDLPTAEGTVIAEVLAAELAER